jgi:hypothetical protein
MGFLIHVLNNPRKQCLLMHTCPAPVGTLKTWLKDTANAVPGYTHLLLESNKPVPSDLAEQLRPYFESAHADARRVFHEYAKIDLHPDSLGSSSTCQYPTSLPATTRHGLFGEVLAGMIVEAYQAQHDKYQWSVPVFLFRHHADVGKYLFFLARDSSRTRQLWGRLGDDFIGLGFDQHKNVERVIVGESKFRDKLSQLGVEDLLLGKREKEDDGTTTRKEDGIWRSFQDAYSVPEGLVQLQAILIERAPTEYAAAITSIDRILAITPKHSIPRTDLVIFSGGSPAKRKPGETFVRSNVLPKEYLAGRDLIVVEAFLENGADLAKKIYDTVWSGVKNG